MALKAGDSFPSGVEFKYVKYQPGLDDITACGIPVSYNTDKEFPSKKVVIVSVPGAFTPTCTANHIPPYIEKFSELKSKGVDQLLVLDANDPFVQNAWAKAMGAFKNEDILFVSDGNADFSKSIGHSLDLTSAGFGLRTARYAMIVDHGKVTYLEQEPGSDVTVSSVDSVLSHL